MIRDRRQFEDKNSLKNLEETGTATLSNFSLTNSTFSSILTVSVKISLTYFLLFRENLPVFLCTRL